MEQGLRSYLEQALMLLSLHESPRAPFAFQDEEGNWTVTDHIDYNAHKGAFPHLMTATRDTELHDKVTDSYIGMCDMFQLAAAIDRVAAFDLDNNLSTINSVAYLFRLFLAESMSVFDSMAAIALSVVRSQIHEIGQQGGYLRTICQSPSFRALISWRSTYPASFQEKLGSTLF